MRYKFEIYHYERKTENVLKRLKNSRIDQNNKVAILDFYRDSLSRGLSKARILKYLTTLEIISRLFSKSFESATRDEIADFVRKIEARNFSEWTKHDYKVILKIFYRWLRGTEGYPDEVKWIDRG